MCNQKWTPFAINDAESRQDCLRPPYVSGLEIKCKSGFFLTVALKDVGTGSRLKVHKIENLFGSEFEFILFHC
jgi:hypothetical protein